MPKDELTEVERLVRDAMMGAAERRVPREVSMGHGQNWLDAHWRMANAVEAPL